jgi:hypothetical protein
MNDESPKPDFKTESQGFDDENRLSERLRPDERGVEQGTRVVPPTEFESVPPA